ncbi:MAG: putative peptide maturation dehydrogenase [Solirubrobacteraceae bacterium]
MPRIRRTPYACFYAEDGAVFDPAALLRGQVPEARDEAQIVALVALTGHRHDISRRELDVLLSVPAARWVEVDGRDDPAVTALIAKGLLLTDSDDASLRALRDRDDALSDNEWNLYAALYHYMTQWSGVELSEGHADVEELSVRSKDVAEAHIAAHGAPPGAFPDIGGREEYRLPRTALDGDLFRTLLSRRTTRSFDHETPMTVDQLDGILQYVFGCHGYARNSADILCIKRTSPSGGGLHPIDAYPLISNVAGLTPGLYRYNANNHSLVLLEALEAAEARSTATSFMCGQKYFGMAHVTFILTARFYRNHWKYRRHQKAYAGLLMDAAHLSQTLYLVGTELNLGAFVTIAINARDIEDRLGIDGVTEGVIAMTGCGPRARGESPLELRFSTDPPGDAR